jgi:DNA-binding MarR family transcriptional regulator
MDNIPMMMRILRSKFREKYAGDLSVVQFRTLAFVNDQQGASLSEAASHIGLGLPSMSKQVETLVKRNLMVREIHGRDRRRICLSLTRQGKDELQEAFRYTQSFFADKFSGLTEAERSQINEALEVMRGLFSPNPRAAPKEPSNGSSGPDL